MDGYERNVKLCEICVTNDTKIVNQERMLLQQRYRKLDAERTKTIGDLELALEEAKTERTQKTKPEEITAADFKIRRAQLALDTGKEKAHAEFEIAYSGIKTDLEKKISSLESEKCWLEYSQDVKEKKFSD